MAEQLICKDLYSKEKDGVLFLDNTFQEFLKESDVEFVGIINRMGNLTTVLKDKDWIESDEKRRMFYMHTGLQICMGKDFDEPLGEITHVVTNRKNSLMIAIPLKGNVVIVSAKPKADVERITKKVMLLEFSKGRF